MTTLVKANLNEIPSEATSGYGALQCNPRSSGCPGSNNNYCEPNVVWSGELKSGTNYYYGNLNSGTFYASTGNNANYTNAYGVRCVLDLDFIKQKETTDSSVTPIRVTEPCGATGQQAARSRMLTTATRTTYGQARQAAVTM